MSVSQRHGFCLVRRLGQKRRLVPIETRCINTLSNKEDHIKTALKVEQHQLDLLSPIDTLRKLFLGPATLRAGSEVRDAAQLPRHTWYNLNQDVKVSLNSDLSKYDPVSRGKRFKDFVFAQIEASPRPQAVLRVISSALGSTEQGTDAKEFRTKALWRDDLQDRLCVKFGKFLIASLKKTEDRESQMTNEQPNLESTASRRELITCLNIIIVLLERAGIALNARLLKMGLVLSAGEPHTIAFRRFLRQIHERNMLLRAKLSPELGLVVLKSLESSIRPRKHLMKSETLACRPSPAFIELLFGTQSQSPISLQNLLPLGNLHLLNYWIQILGSAGAESQLKELWAWFRNSSDNVRLDDDSNPKLSLTGAFVIAFCRIGRPELAWLVYKEKGMDVPLEETITIRYLLDIVQRKPQLDNEQLVAHLEKQCIHLLSLDLRHLEQILGLSWIPQSDEVDQHSSSSSSSFGGHHDILVDDILKHWTKALTEARTKRYMEKQDSSGLGDHDLTILQLFEAIG